jgi:hypothetical protein
MLGGRTHIAVLGGLVALLLLLPSGAGAQGPTVPDVILGGHLYPKPYGNTYVYGHVRVPATEPATDVAGQTVQLYASAFPFVDWQQIATLTTDWEGYFSYHTTIGQNTSYRAIWQTAAPVQSKDKLVKLPLKLSLRASHRRVKRGGVVTFAGATRPLHPGVPIDIQQMDRRGRFTTVAHTTVAPNSSFSLRARLRRGGVFRALFAGDGQFGVAASRPLRVVAVKRH